MSEEKSLVELWAGAEPASVQADESVSRPNLSPALAQAIADIVRDTIRQELRPGGLLYTLAHTLPYDNGNRG